VLDVLSPVPGADVKNALALFALLAGLSLAGAAGAQSPGQNPETGKVGAPPPVVATPPTVMAPALVPNVESVDILKQNQAERTRDQPGNAAPTFRIIKEGTKNYSSLPALEAGVLIQPKQQFPLQARATTAG
jgi:formate dehydrogenase subunit gamma